MPLDPRSRGNLMHAHEFVGRVETIRKDINICSQDLHARSLISYGWWPRNTLYTWTPMVGGFT